MNPVTESSTASPVIRVAKIGMCPSISGLSELTFHIGYEADDPQRIHFRLAHNTGNGKIHPGWLALADLEQALASVPAESPFKAAVLAALFRGRSTNNLHFTIAVLLHCGLLKRAEPAEEGYVRNVPKELWAELSGLIAAGTDLVSPSMAASVAGGEPVPEKTPKAGRKPSRAAAAATLS